MRAIQRERLQEPITLLEQLGEWFPRVAFGAVLVIGLCLAVDFSSALFGQTDLASGVAALSEQWLFATKGF